PPIANQPKFSFCTGGSGATGGYTRASDPWVTIAPNGHAYFMALQADIGVTLTDNAMSVAKSTDHGATWSAPIVLRRDTSPNVLNDKNSITADRFDSNFVYAIWDRLEFPNEQAARQAGEHAIGFRGPAWLARTTNGGASWETARIIYDPGEINQTIGNQIVVTGDGTLVNGFALIFNLTNRFKARGFNVAVLRSTDRGATWSGATIVSHFVPGTVADPTTGAPVRTGDNIPEIAADPRAGSATVYMVWQAPTASSRSAVFFSKSTDDGRSWSAPKVINRQSTVQAFTPSIRVGADGTVAVTYYDFRNDTGTAPLDTDLWAITSSDGGESWAEVHVSGPFDMSTAPVARGYFVGDYEGLDSGRDPATGRVFFLAGFGQGDGTARERSSHIYASRGE
ncbi:MAG TPA: sialidase family protein, partial [Chloroflexota bacterium]